jgi:hypothetical protein
MKLKFVDHIKIFICYKNKSRVTGPDLKFCVTRTEKFSLPGLMK